MVRVAVGFFSSELPVIVERITHACHRAECRAPWDWSKGGERGKGREREERERETAADGSNMSGDWRFEVCFEVCVYSFLRCVCIVL